MKKKLIQVIKILFFLLVLFFLGRYFLENWEAIQQIQWNINTGNLILSFLLYFCYIITLASLWHYITKLNQCENWLVAGAGFYLLVKSVYPVPASQWLYTGGIYGLSTIIGILALFAPSGLGVREGILTAGLCLIMPEEYALTISLISRLWQTVAEILLVSGAFLVNQVKRRLQQNSG